MKKLFCRATGVTVRTTRLALIAGLTLFAGAALATTQIGYTTTSTRSVIPSNLYTTQWGGSPLFNFILQSSADQWGYDLIHATNTFGVASATGTPSQSGWHTHPVPIGLVQVISGGLWIQEGADLTCLAYYPTGSMFVEGAGHVHNAYNFNKTTPAVTLATWFLDRNLSSTRTDVPDPITGNPTVASPTPTAICPGSPVPPPTQ
jgi:quercetin dioxygenase-like cupin family protein